MIYSHKSDIAKRNLSPAECEKLKRLQRTESTAWMIETAC